MACILLFSTSHLVTLELIQALQVDNDLTFHQARKDPTQQPVASFQALDDDHVESDGVFGVLDAQSAKDHTIVIDVEYGVMDERMERTVGSRWYTWRVKFSAVDKLLTPFVIDPYEVIEEVLLQPEAFIGVFDVERAVQDWLRRGASKGTPEIEGDDERAPKL